TVEAYELSHGGERFSEAPRQEKCVDVALATKLIEDAATGACDTAIVIAGDRDFLPAIQAARRFGTVILLASVRQHCSGKYRHANDLFAAPIVWLDDFANDLARRDGDGR